MAISKEKRRRKIKGGIRRKINGTAERPRLSVFKSNRAIYAQLINDDEGNTLAAANSIEIGIKGNIKIEDAKKVGVKIAEKAKKDGIGQVVFDRNGYPYHGKVKSLAEGAREGGLKF